VPRLLARRGRFMAATAWAVAAVSSWAAEGPSGLTAEVGVSRASSSSPVFRFSPDGALVRLEGRNQLSGTLFEVALSGQRDWQLADEWRPSVALRADRSWSRQAPDLQFGQVSLDAALRRPLGAGMAGVGLTMQRLWAGGRAFRTVPGVRLDWARGFGTGSHGMLAYERARYRHTAEFNDLDARVQQVSANARISQPWAGVTGLDLDMGWRREDNQRGLPDQSGLGRHLRLGLDRDLGGWTFSTALMVNRATYREGIDELLPARREWSLSLEAAASLDLGEGRSVRVQALWARNRARPALYDNRYRSFGMGYATPW
jgi:hypothetical protein